MRNGPLSSANWMLGLSGIEEAEQLFFLMTTQRSPDPHMAHNGARD
jgi:hypothetical protein